MPAASAGRAKQTAKRSGPKPAGGSGGGGSSRKRAAAPAPDPDSDEEAAAPLAAAALANASSDLSAAAAARGDPVQEVLDGADKRKRAAGSNSQKKAAKASASASAAAASPRATTNPSSSARATSVDFDDDDDEGAAVGAPPLAPTAGRRIEPLQTQGGTPVGGTSRDGGSPAVPGGPKVGSLSQREVKKAKRVPFSSEEETYVLQGYEKYKTKKQMWAIILKEYPFNPTRTSVDIKDKYRNLMKKQQN